MTRWPGWLLLIAVGVDAAVTGYSLLRYPGNLDDPAAPVYLIALGAILAGYVALAGWALRRPVAGRGLGALFGLAAAAAWSIEIWAGGPADFGRTAEKAVGATFALLAVALTVAAGIVAGLRIRRPGAAAQAGLFAGLVSGATLFGVAVVMTLASLGTLAARDDYRQQFATSRSHLPDIATFLVGDIIAAVIAHLFINVVLGMLGAGLGALAAKVPPLGDARTAPAS
jgi:hypothetical protein